MFLSLNKNPSNFIINCTCNILKREGLNEFPTYLSIHRIACNSLESLLSWFICFTIAFKVLIAFFSSVPLSCPILWDPMDCSTPGLPVHQQLLEFTKTHVHCVGDAFQQSHPLSFLFPPASNLSQYQGLFK